MTRTLAVSIFKGGTGKTTTAVNLAAALSRLGRRVLLINTDTQPQCSQSLGVAPSTGLAHFVRGAAPADAIIEARPNLHLLAGGAPLAELKMEIARKPFGGEATIAKALERLNGQYDYVIIDTGPGFDSLSIAALFAAHEIISPVTLEALAINGLVDFVRQLATIQEHHNVELSYILPTSLDRRVAQTDEILKQLQDHFSSIVCEPIRYNIRLSEASGHGKHIFEYSPRSRGAADYAQLTERILNDG